MKNPPHRAGVSASRPARTKSPEFTFEREDWTLFRSLSTLSQKAGVPVHLLPKLVLKELADNALDAGGTVRVGQLEDGGWYVEDDGPGIAGEPADIARLFSIRRPLVSSKLLRLPTRGALGNGLRVVAGAVLASGGRLVLETRGRRLDLRPQDNGDTLATFEPCARTTGTRIEIHLGEGLSGSDALAWARSAAELAGRGEVYRGRSSPHWYDGEAFFDLLQAAGNRSVRELVAELDGCTGAKAGKIATAFKGRACSSLSRAEAIALLEAAQQQARPVSPSAARPCRRGRGLAAVPCPWRGYVPLRRHRRPPRHDPLRGRGLGLGRARRLWQQLLGAGQPHADHRHGQPLALATRSDSQRLRPHEHPPRCTRALGHRSAHQRHHALHADHLRRQGAQPVLLQRGHPRGRRQGRAARPARRAARAKKQAAARRRSCSPISTRRSPRRAGMAPIASRRARCST